MKQNIFNYVQCNKTGKHILQNACMSQSITPNKCSIDKKICKANIKN